MSLSQPKRWRVVHVSITRGTPLQLSHTILEGHRFAIASISEEAPLLSWGLPFGYAIRSIAPGDYVCNQKMIDSLSIRNLPFELPENT